MVRILIRTILLIAAITVTCSLPTGASQNNEAAILHDGKFRSLILHADWDSAAKVLASDTTWIESPSGALLAAHVNLATGNYNGATLLFFSVVSSSDLDDWKKWTWNLRKNEPGNPVALYLYGDALARLGLMEEAIGEFTVAIEKDPSFYLAYNARGLARSILADRMEGEERNRALSIAVEDFEDASNISDSFLDARANLALTFIQSGDAENTADEFLGIIDEDSSFAMAYNGRACALAKSGDSAAAASDIIMADSLCRTPYTVLNAKMLSSISAGSDKIREIAGAVPDSVMEQFRGVYQSHEFEITQTPSYTDMTTREQMPAIHSIHGDRYDMAWPQKLEANMKIFTGAFMTTLGISNFFIGGPTGFLAGAGMVGQGLVNISSGFAQLSMLHSDMRGGVYFDKRIMRSGTPEGLGTEAVLNYPRLPLETVEDTAE